MMTNETLSDRLKEIRCLELPRGEEALDTDQLPTVFVPRSMVGPRNKEVLSTQIELGPYAASDSKGPVIRYLWFKHDTRHDEFVRGYFEKGNEHSLNVRALTKHLWPLWAPHNSAIGQALRSNDILWRVKAYNPIEKTVDHIEVWKDRATIDRYFRSDLLLDDGQVWSDGQRQALSQGLYECGLRIFVIDGYAVSATAANYSYEHFARRAAVKDACIIEKHPSE
jgi:hypothetical protein